MNKYMREVLRKMCDDVGAKEVNFKEKEWFLKHSWSHKQEEEFKNWLVNYLYRSSKARSHLMRFPIKNKELISKFASFFILNHGWKSYKDEKDDKTGN